MSGTHVLVVHPDPGIGAKIAAAIQRAGFDARAVTSGERAMDRFIQEPADVIVVDQDLDGRTGIATIGAIRRMPGGRTARVVLIADEDTGERSIEDLAKSVDVFASFVGTWDFDAIAGAVARAAAARPHDAETRELSLEQVQLAAERARPPSAHEWEEVTNPGEKDGEPEGGWEWRDSDGSAEAREVQAAREASEETPSDTAGTFEQLSFARLLRRLAVKRVSGALVCVHPADGRATTNGSEPTKIVYFRGGFPVHVRSNLVSECLGQVLAREKKIGPATLDASLAAMQRGEGLQGEVLLTMGALTPLELSEALADQLRTKLTDLFGWRRGKFRFAADRTPPRSLVDLGLGLAELTLLGVREGIALREILGELTPHEARYAVLDPRELVAFLRHGPIELIRAIDGTSTVRELLARAGDPNSMAQLLYAMHCLDAVRFVEQPAPRPARGIFREEELTPIQAADPTPVEPTPAERTPAETAPIPTLEDRPDDVAPLHTVIEPPRKKPVPRAEREESGVSATPARVPRSPRAELAPEPDEAGTRPKILDERLERLLAAERHFRRGQAALDRGRADEAVRALAHAAQLCPEEGQFLSYLGWAKHAAAPDDAFVLSEAVDLAERGSQRSPELAIGHLLRGRLLSAIGRTADAHAAFRRSLELDPSLDEARAAIART